MKSKVFLLLAALPLIFCAPVFPADPVPLEVSEVAPGIYAHFGQHELPDRKNHGEIANIGFIVGSRCVAVIDTGGNPRQGAALKKAVKQKTSLPVCYVINTHVHPDHIYGNIAFKAPGVKFVGHHKLARAMSMRGLYYIGKAPDQIGVKLTETDIIPPDMAVKGKLTLDLGERELELTAHPTAHTDNDLSVYDKNTDTLWLADLLFIGHIPVIDGSLKGWLRELNKLEKRRYARVIPGHGPVVTDWPKSLRPEMDYLQMVLSETRALIRQGKFIEDAVESVGLSAKGRWQLFDRFHRKNVTTAFAELEWEE
ncbi:MAG: quinoprotein relay system zinc metallohydrolase 2 [Gammaproteobacteria bacterium]